MIYCNDLCADIAAERFDVSWVKTSPMVMSVGDDITGYFLSGESSFYFGRTAYGDLDDVRSFYFACSASFSPIEHYVAHALFPNDGNNGSATVGLGFILDNGGEIEIIQDGDLTLIREVGSNDKILVFDSSTGLICDQIITNFSGAYCYSDQQTEWGCDFGQNMLNAKNDIWNFVFNNSFMDWANNDVLGVAGSVALTLGVSAVLVSNPVGWAVGAALIVGGLYTTYYADDLNRGVTWDRAANFAIDVSTSVLTPYGATNAISKVYIRKELSKESVKLIEKNNYKFTKDALKDFGSEIYGSNKGEIFKKMSKDYLKGKVPDGIIYYNYSHDVEYVWNSTFDLRLLQYWGIINF